MKKLKKNTLEKLPRVTRVEVIDDTGRVLVRYNQEVVLSIQDEGKTLKLFIEERD